MTRTIAIALCALMLLGVAGCAAPAATPAPAPVAPTAAPAAAPASAAPAAPAAPVATPAPAPAATPAAAAPAVKPPVTIKWICRLPATFVVENNPVVEELGKRINAKIELEAPPINNYQDRLNIVMSSGDVHDLIYVTGNLYSQWAADGLLLEFDNNVLAKLPNVTKELTEMEISTQRVPSVDNKLFAIPRVQTKPADCIVYRGDWLQKLNLEVPKTPEDFHTVAKAFSHDDPDGNGKADTYGFSLNPITITHRNISYAFFKPDSIANDDGTYTITQAKPGFIAHMDWLHDMFADGSMDPEWYLNKQYDDSDKFTAGKIGINYKDPTTSHSMLSFTSKDFQAANPNGLTVPGAPLRADANAPAVDYWNPQLWGNWGVSAKSKVIDETLALIDYGYTDEGNELLYFGMPGLTFTKIENGFVERTPAQKEESAKWASSYLSLRYRGPNKALPNAAGDTLDQVAEFNKREAWLRSETTYVDYLPAWEAIVPGGDKIRVANDDLNKEHTTLLTKYISNEIKREEYLKFLNEKYIPAWKEYEALLNAAQINKGIK